MIKDISVNDGKLTWYNNNNLYHFTINQGTFINDDNNILIMNEVRNKVVVLDECGVQIGELLNSEDMYLNYLQKHPRFGISVVVSLKDYKGNWSDKYLSWIENKFENMSNSR